MLSDIGVYQTSNPAVATIVHQIQVSAIRNHVTQRTGQTYAKATQRAWLIRGINAALSAGSSNVEAEASVAPWPSGTHDEVIADSVPGLLPSDMGEVQNGSRAVDLGVGYTNLWPNQAPLHSMVPVDWIHQHGIAKATEDAKKAAADFVEHQLSEAMRFMRKATISPFKDEAAAWRRKAFVAFGMAIHPLMDEVSPMHGWQPYGISYNQATFFRDLYHHSQGEKESPTAAQMSLMRSQIQAAFKRTFSSAEYDRAITARK